MGHANCFRECSRVLFDSTPRSLGSLHVRMAGISGVGNQVHTIRVLRGYEPQNGACDPAQTYAFWFDPGGRLIRFCERVDVRYSDFKDFNGAQVPQHISVLEGEKTLVSIQIDEMRPLDLDIPNENFDLPSTPIDHSFTTAIEAR